MIAISGFTLFKQALEHQSIIKKQQETPTEGTQSEHSMLNGYESLSNHEKKLRCCFRKEISTTVVNDAELES